MTLQIRLTLVNLALIALFLLSFAATWALAGGGDLMRPPPPRLAQRLGQKADLLYARSGRQGLQTALQESLFPLEGASLYDAKGQLVFEMGKRFPPDPAGLARCLQGEIQDHRGPGSKGLWAPLPESRCALRLNLEHGENSETGARLASLLLLSALVSTSLSALAGFYFSRAVSSPLRRLTGATEALSRSDFRHRVQTQGSGELRELAASFNRMADHLEVTIEFLTQAKEKAERSEASRRQFMADVSHNLKTPLAAVIGWSDALIDGVSSGDPQEHLHNIRDQVLYLAQNVQRLTDWCRWEDQPPVLKLEEFPVSEPLMDCLATLEDVAQRRGVTLEVRGLEEEPQVYGDRSRLRDLFQLLLENAIQHNAEGCKLSVVLKKTAANRLEVMVADDGVGLPASLAQDLECRDGGGLGLAIACRLARAHGSELRRVEQASGTCLTFWLELR